MTSAPGAAEVLAVLRERGQTLATAESLTGGLIGQQLTSVPGASSVYVGGVISYATRLKAVLAGVDQSTLDEVGPVASLTARQMALGVAHRCGADWGVSATGVAGPDPQDGHPVGQVFVGVGRTGSSRSWVAELTLSGSREEIRQGAFEGALRLLADVLGMNA
jgi:nicotinamide-nucleotide amidase